MRKQPGSQDERKKDRCGGDPGYAEQSFPDGEGSSENRLILAFVFSDVNTQNYWLIRQDRTAWCATMKLTEAQSGTALNLREVEELVGQIEALPALPVILAELMQTMERSASEVDLNRVVELVSRDESVAGQCLHMANSALFGRRSLVETVHEAVVILGLWRVNDIVFRARSRTFSSRFQKAWTGPHFGGMRLAARY